MRNFSIFHLLLCLLFFWNNLATTLAALTLTPEDHPFADNLRKPETEPEVGVMQRRIGEILTAQRKEICKNPYNFFGQDEEEAKKQIADFNDLVKDKYDESDKLLFEQLSKDRYKGCRGIMRDTILNPTKEQLKKLKQEAEKFGTFSSAGFDSKKYPMEITRFSSYRKCEEVISLQRKYKEELGLTPHSGYMMSVLEDVCKMLFMKEYSPRERYEECDIKKLNSYYTEEKFDVGIYIATINKNIVGAIGTYLYYPNTNDWKGGCILRFQGIHKTTLYLTLKDRSQKKSFRTQIFEKLEAEAKRLTCTAMAVMKPTGPMLKFFDDPRNQFKKVRYSDSRRCTTTNYCKYLMDTLLGISKIYAIKYLTEDAKTYDENFKPATRGNKYPLTTKSLSYDLFRECFQMLKENEDD